MENNLIDNVTIFPLELNTMPGFAGSSAYYLRYMDPHNAQALVSEKADHYWQNVDLYVGGTEYGVAHLRGRNLAERARALIAVAHPSVREELERAAAERFGYSFLRLKA